MGRQPPSRGVGGRELPRTRRWVWGRQIPRGGRQLISFVRVQRPDTERRALPPASRNARSSSRTRNAAWHHRPAFPPTVEQHEADTPKNPLTSIKRACRAPRTWRADLEPLQVGLGKARDRWRVFAKGEQPHYCAFRCLPGRHVTSAKRTHVQHRFNRNQSIGTGSFAKGVPR